VTIVCFLIEYQISPDFEKKIALYNNTAVSGIFALRAILLFPQLPGFCWHLQQYYYQYITG
jgi:hypothetical protein